jgi:hypothetical protein
MDDERLNQLRSMSFLGFVREWMLLMLQRPCEVRYIYVRHYVGRPVLFVRVFRALRTWVCLPFRLLSQYRYARLSQEARERAEDEWLASTLNKLRGSGRLKAVRSMVDSNFIEDVPNCDFVRAIRGEL